MIDKRKLNTARNLSRYTSVADEFLDMHIKPSSEWKSWRSLVVKFSISLPYLMYLTYVMFGLKKEKTSLFCSKSSQITKSFNFHKEKLAF